ncbi:MAG: hypothetical protein AB7N70_33780 [Dehalococcoidia bacterium]
MRQACCAAVNRDRVWMKMRILGLLLVAALLVVAGASISWAIETVFLVELAIVGVVVLAAGALIFSAWWTERQQRP